MTTPKFRPRKIFDVLRRHDVRFVVIGGIGARLRGSPIITNDTDICHARDDQNLEHLAAALRDLDVRLRGAPEDVPFWLDAKTLKAGDHFTFVSSSGSFDCLGTPAGVRGFEELDEHASTMSFSGTPVRVASIDDLIRMKLAAGRPKDLEAVETLAALREEIEERGEA